MIWPTKQNLLYIYIYIFFQLDLFDIFFAFLIECPNPWWNIAWSMSRKHGHSLVPLWANVMEWFDPWLATNPTGLEWPQSGLLQTNPGMAAWPAASQTPVTCWWLHIDGQVQNGRWPWQPWPIQGVDPLAIGTGGTIQSNSILVIGLGVFFHVVALSLVIGLGCFISGASRPVAKWAHCLIHWHLDLWNRLWLPLWQASKWPKWCNMNAMKTNLQSNQMWSKLLMANLMDDVALLSKEWPPRLPNMETEHCWVWVAMVAIMQQSSGHKGCIAWTLGTQGK